MKFNRKMIPYLFVNALVFYLLPIAIQDTGSALFLSLLVTPAICFVAAVTFGAKNSFNWFYPVAVALIFTPTIFIYYNESAAIYIAVYGVVALVGNFIGRLLYKPDRTN